MDTFDPRNFPNFGDLSIPNTQFLTSLQIPTTLLSLLRTTFDNVTDIDNASGFSIILGKIDSSGNITDTTNYYYFVSSSTATSGDVYGGGDNCTSGPVTLSA